MIWRTRNFGNSCLINNFKFILVLSISSPLLYQNHQLKTIALDNSILGNEHMKVGWGKN